MNGYYTRVLSMRRVLSTAICVGIVSLFSTQDVIAQPEDVKSLKTKLSRITKDDTTKVNTLNDLSYQYQWMDFDSSMQFADQALSLAHKINFKRGIAMANFRKSHCYWALAAVDLSIEKALLAVKLSQEGGFKDIMAESYRMLAFSYRDQQEVAKAEHYVAMAEEICQETKNWDLLVRIYNLRGILARNKLYTDTTTALIYYHKAIELHKKYKTEPFHMCGVLGNIGDVYLDINHNKAMMYYREGLAIANESRNRAVQAGIRSGIGRVLIAQKKYREAEQVLNESLVIARQLGFKRMIMTLYSVLSDLKNAEGNAKDAIRYMDRYYTVRDSIIQTRKIVQLEARHETEKQAQAIQLLEQEKKVKNIWIGLLVVGSLLLAVIMIIIYKLQQSRNQKAKQLIEVHRQLNAKLTETDHLKSRFFANISHEFRTPLSLILAPIERKLNSVSLSDSDKSDLRLVQRNANRLLDLINQLLDLSKLEAGKMKLRIQQGSLDEFLKILTSSFDSLAEAKKLRSPKPFQYPVQMCGMIRINLKKL